MCVVWRTIPTVEASLDLSPLDLSLASRSRQRSIKARLLAAIQLTTLGSTATAIPSEYVALEALSELSRKLPLAEQLVGEFALEASDGILAQHRQEFKCAVVLLLARVIKKRYYAFAYCPLPPVAMKRFLCSGW